MKKIIVIFLILFTSLINAQTTLIPDYDFELFLINQGFDFGAPDGSVLTADIDYIQYLDVSNQNINDLTGIEDFTSLINLNCSFNYLSSLDITQNTNLINLNCMSNNITNLDVTQNTALTHIYCATNQLVSLDVTQNSVLEILSCNGNSLTSLNITQNNSLTELSCGNNQLNALDVSLNIALTAISCGENPIMNINVSQNIALKNLTCNNNSLSSLDVTSNANLEVLSCFNNSLTNLDTTQCANLKTLWCNNNSISELYLTQNISLTNLKCENNQLGCLNIKNGNNSSMFNFKATNNVNLSCIEVDDASWATTNWTVASGHIDANSSFSLDCASNCNTLALDEYEYDSTHFLIYPNPTSKVLKISNLNSYEEYKIFDISGKEISNGNISNNENINIENLTNGVYFLKFKSGATKKFIKK